MSYPWTRVPGGDPPTDRLQLRLLPVVDLVMGLLWSRPGGLSLRTTWVTPATIGLGLVVSAVAGFSGLAATAYGIRAAYIPETVGGLLALVLAVGAGAVAIFGIRQRLIR